MRFQIRVTAVLRFLKRFTAVTPGRLFQIATGRSAGQLAANSASSFSLAKESKGRAGRRWRQVASDKGHGTKFARKMEAAIAALLSHRTLEEAARAVGVSPNALLRWQQDPEFDAAFRKARRAADGQTTARLHQASSAPVSAVLKIMVDGSAPASTRLRAADIVLAHMAKAIEVEDIEARVAALEAAAASGP